MFSLTKEKMLFLKWLSLIERAVFKTKIPVSVLLKYNLISVIQKNYVNSNPVYNLANINSYIYLACKSSLQ